MPSRYSNPEPRLCFVWPKPRPGAIENPRSTFSKYLSILTGKGPDIYITKYSGRSQNLKPPVKRSSPDVVRDPDEDDWNGRGSSSNTTTAHRGDNWNGRSGGRRFDGRPTMEEWTRWDKVQDGPNRVYEKGWNDPWQRHQKPTREMRDWCFLGKVKAGRVYDPGTDRYVKWNPYTIKKVDWMRDDDGYWRRVGFWDSGGRYIAEARRDARRKDPGWETKDLFFDQDHSQQQDPMPQFESW